MEFDNRPSWSTDYKYRIKPKLYWYDLKVGDVLRTDECEVLITHKSYEDNTNLHIYTDHWIDDEHLSRYTLIRRVKDV